MALNMESECLGGIGGPDSCNGTAEKGQHNCPSCRAKVKRFDESIEWGRKCDAMTLPELRDCRSKTREELAELKASYDPCVDTKAKSGRISFLEGRLWGLDDRYMSMTRLQIHGYLEDEKCDPEWRPSRPSE